MHVRSLKGDDVAAFQVRTVLQMGTLLPADVAATSMTIISSDPTPNFDTIVSNFWNTSGTYGATTGTVAQLIGAQVIRTGSLSRIETYEIDLATGAVGTPIRYTPFNLGTGTGGSTPLPSEVALCTSFAAGPAVGVNPARRKGRMFIGPLNEVSLDTSLANQAVVSSTARIILAGATERLADDLITAGHELAVWSRVDQAAYPVVRGWVDNAFDTQRRRGIEPSLRTVWTL